MPRFRRKRKILNLASAASRHASIEYTGLGDLGVLEDAVR